MNNTPEVNIPAIIYLGHISTTIDLLNSDQFGKQLAALYVWTNPSTLRVIISDHSVQKSAYIDVHQAVLDSCVDPAILANDSLKQCLLLINQQLHPEADLPVATHPLKEDPHNG